MQRRASSSGEAADSGAGASGAPGADTPAAARPVVAAALLAVASLTVIANATIAPSLPGLGAHFRDTPYVNTLVGLVMTLPSLGIVLTAALAGYLCDRIGRRPVMLVSLMLYGLAGASGVVAQSLGWILTGRMLLGLGIGGTMTSALAMIADLYQGPARQRLMSLQTATMSGTGVLFLLLGGMLGEPGWRYPFLVYLLALALVPVAWRLLPEPPRGRIDAARSHERLPPGPLALVTTSALLSMIAFYLLPTRLPFRLADLGITSPTIAGVAVAVGNLTMVLGAMSYGRVGSRLQARAVYALLFGLTAVGYLIIAKATTLPAVLFGAAIAGAGYGWMFPVNSVTLMEATPPSMRGRASGLLTTSIFLGQFLSPLVSGPMVDQVGVAGAYVWFAAGSAAVAVVFGLMELARRRL